MYFHTAAYSESIAALTNTDIDVVDDTVIQRRNSHLILSEPFNLIAAVPFGDTITRARFGNVALTVRGTNHMYPLMPGATNLSRPPLMDRRTRPIMLPINEEITVEVTNTGVGPAQHGAILWLAKPQWKMTLPQGLDRFVTRATVVVAAGTETTWTTPAPLVFERDLFNGVYSVVGCQVVAANTRAFRLFFPSQPQTEGRQLRPGGLSQDLITDIPHPEFMGGFGEWGRFHTFEPPSVQMLADAAGGTYEVRLDLVYLGTTVSALIGRV